MNNLHTVVVQSQQELDPPLTCSNLPQTHELPVTAINTVPRTVSTPRTEHEVATSASTDVEQNESLEEQERDVETPLRSRKTRVGLREFRNIGYTAAILEDCDILACRLR